MDSLNHCVSQERLFFIFIFKRIFTGYRILVDGFLFLLLKMLYSLTFQLIFPRKSFLILAFILVLCHGTCFSGWLLAFLCLQQFRHFEYDIPRCAWTWGK